MDYENYLKRWIAPRWGTYPLRKIKPIEVESWLRELPLARSSCAKIRNLMSVLFNHACRYELYSENPIHLVRQGAKRRRAPYILHVDEIKRLLDNVASLDQLGRTEAVTKQLLRRLISVAISESPANLSGNTSPMPPR
jgi:integrase